ncbi:MAG: hypothetical protein LBD85_07515, partial [Oscillospiraceae bacterium]|nr:hypothetical protein [Oscillospiraceae bacterium]
MTKRMTKRTITLVSAAALLLAVVLISVPPARAVANYDVSSGNVVINSNGDYTITGTTTQYTIKVNSGVTATITLNNVDIDLYEPYNVSAACAFDMSGATVNLILVGTNKLRSRYYRAGLQAPTGSTLTINGPGSLEATGIMRGAGIGGYNSNSTGGDADGHGGGTIIINSGNIKATGGLYAAGIGGGNDADNSQFNLTIKGGNVEAEGWVGAGIGGGTKSGTTTGSGGTITITGGTVTAKGSERGAGIGGGPGAAGDKITITGGTVTATGGDRGAGIGGGQYGFGGTIEISGSNTVVYAKGGAGGAGIGGGADHSWGGTTNITISGGKVEAYGGSGGETTPGGAGIGGG